MGERNPGAVRLLASAIVAVVFVGFCLIGLLRLVATSPSAGQLLLGVVYLALLLAVQLLYFGGRSGRVRPPLSHAVLVLQACLVYLPLFQFGAAWATLPGFLAGSALLVLPPVLAWGVFAAVVTSVTWQQFQLDPSLSMACYVSIGTAVTGLVVYGLTRFAELVSELHAARTDLARSAVAGERLRFARDLHDLLGLSLSGIALRGELAHRLVGRDPARAGQELAQILQICRRALADVRALARGYRELPLEEEARSVTAVLTNRLARRSTIVLVAAVFCGFFLIASIRAIDLGRGVAQTVVAVACMALLLAVQLLYFGGRSGRVRPPLSYMVLGLQACLVYLPMPLLGATWVSLPGFLAGSALLVLPPVLAWGVFAAVVASIATHGATVAAPVGDTVVHVVATVNSGLATWGLVLLAGLVSELHAARTGLARSAVAGERLRFARDLHDLLGLSLSGIVLKGELAHRLVGRDPARAGQELAQILQICRRALADVRALARGYRELPLEEEARSVTAVLTAADVELRMDLDYNGLPAQVRTVLATVLREGVTNMLRHSKVERCEIRMVQADRTVQLDILNDGLANPGSDSDPPTERGTGQGGNGLRNLSERVAALGGELTAGVDPDHRFRLRAILPSRASPER